MSAYQAYRQEVHGIIKSDNVLRFLIQNRRFPRSFAHCIGEAKSCLLNLPNSKNLVAQTTSILKDIDELTFDKLAGKTLYLLIDNLQIELGDLNQSITQSYFSLERERKQQKQSQKNAAA